MENKLCDNCIYCYKPTSIKDYFDRTLQMPDLCKWGVDVFKHEFWLCTSPIVSKVDHTDNTLVCKPCQIQNFRGNCEQFRISSAEDIVPSSIEIASTEPIPEKIKIETVITLESTVTPANIPAVTKEVTVEKEVPVTDSEGNPVYDGNNDPVTEIKEVTETIIVVPEHENDQDIHYSYQWYKNGRKLFKETKSTITINTSEEEIAVYSCELIQDIKQNGDGGKKHASVMSNEITLDVVKPIENIITLTVKTGSVKIFLPIPFKVSDFDYPLTASWTEDWIIKSASENRPELELTTELLENIRVICSEGIEVDIDTENNSLSFVSNKENTNGTMAIIWETID